MAHKQQINNSSKNILRHKNPCKQKKSKEN